MRGAAEQADEADEAFGGTVACMEVPPHARAGWVGRGHRFAAYPRCSADLRTRRRMAIQVREAVPADRPWIRDVISQEWCTPVVVSHGTAHHVDELPGLVAMDAGEPVGLLTYEINGLQLEVVTLQALERLKGVGRILLEAAKSIARESGCRRVWLVTTNDNTPAQSFFGAVGMRLAMVHRGAVRQSRVLKPEIPSVGLNGVPIDDDIEFEVAL